MTILGIIIVTLASAGLVWLVDLCCRHELTMLEQRARNGEANDLRGGDQGLGVHTQLGTQTQERNHVR